jgi:hypothetical protein
MQAKSYLPLGSIILACLVTGLAAQDQPDPTRKTGAADVKAKSSHAWTLDKAREQLRIYPKDAYLQYATLQLARRAGEAETVGREIKMLAGNTPRQARNERAERVDLFNIFSGAQAIQESLQLETMLGDQPLAVPARSPGLVKGRPDGAADPARQAREAEEKRRREQVAVASLTGPTVKSHPWEEMLAGKKPAISLLAQSVPEDYYFAEFRSLTKLLDAIDAGDLWGKYFFNQAEQEARSQRIGERLKKQLVMETNVLLRPIYDSVVESVAVTGSDAFVAEGADVTMIFRYKQEELFKARMDGFLANAAKSRHDAKRTSGTHQGIAFVHVETPDRTIHVYSAYPKPMMHVRSNSRVAFERVLATILGETADGKPVRRLGDTKEFAYIRTLMPQGRQRKMASFISPIRLFAGWLAPS